MMDESDGIEGRFCSEDQSEHKQVSILFKFNCFDIKLKQITHEFSIYLIKQMGSNIRKLRSSSGYSIIFFLSNFMKFKNRLKFEQNKSKFGQKNYSTFSPLTNKKITKNQTIFSKKKTYFPNFLYFSIKNGLKRKTYNNNDNIHYIFVR